MGSFAFLELFLAERSASRGKNPSPTSRRPTSTDFPYFPYFPRTGAPTATRDQAARSDREAVRRSEGARRVDRRLLDARIRDTPLGEDLCVIPRLDQLVHGIGDRLGQARVLCGDESDWCGADLAEELGSLDVLLVVLQAQYRPEEQVDLAVRQTQEDARESCLLYTSDAADDCSIV